MNLEERFAYGSFRAGQREFAQRIYDACTSNSTLVAEAMSGFGKTAAALTGALAAGEERGLRVVYACRTKRQIQRVVEEISQLQARHPFKAAALFSKYDYCLLRREKSIPQESFGWYCSFNVSNNLCTYFMNVPLVEEEFSLIVERTVNSTPKHLDLMRDSESIHVCPYEVARLALVQAQVAVVPYHYVFDRRAAPVLFGSDSPDLSKAILVVDEAHNLRDFFRGANSATLSMGQIDAAIEEAKAMLMDDAAASLVAFQSSLKAVYGTGSGWLLDKNSVVQAIREARGVPWLQNLAFELGSCSGAAWGSMAYERRLPAKILRVSDFIVKLLTSNRGVLVRLQGGFGIVDPHPVGDLEGYLKGLAAAVLMSATISPSAVFIRSLGLKPSDVASYEVGVAPRVQVRTVIDTGVSTRFKLRTPEMLTKISDRIVSVTHATDSGVGVFAPSYALLDELRHAASRRLGSRPVVSESSRLSSQEASDVFDEFSTRRNSVLFAVQGGRFSEGEDFKESSMGAVIVVGLSLPPPSPILYTEYSAMRRIGEQESYLMLSLLPAARKAFQAAGRHIRRPGKKGLVVLLDSRFDQASVKQLMPSWLGDDLVSGDFGPEGLGAITREFWSDHR